MPVRYTYVDIHFPDKSRLHLDGEIKKIESFGFDRLWISVVTRRSAVHVITRLFSLTLPFHMEIFRSFFLMFSTYCPRNLVISEIVRSSNIAVLSCALR